jgi:Ca2+-transporting ATPase
VPFLNRAFSFQPITLKEYLLALALALSVIPVVEIEKAIRRMILRKPADSPDREPGKA